jgi:glycosyltransferase involved in cell wall biosynthesis
MKKRKIRVTACIITYNHEEFLRQCLDQAVNQKLEYEYDIVIGEDKSTDGTLEICKEYKRKYPELINLIEREKNLGLIGNWLDTLSRCTGDYIAICEGDDFWTDLSKLQKQVSFLEQNPEYTLCCTKVQTSKGNQVGVVNHSKIFGKVTLEDLLWKNQFGTCTAVFPAKNLIIPPFPNYKNFFTGDWPLWCSLLKQGVGYNMDCITAQYRVHAGGATSGRNRINTLKNKLEDRLLMMENFPAKKGIIKKYGLKIIFHYLWKSILLHKDYYNALLSNRKLVKDYILT